MFHCCVVAPVFKRRHSRCRHAPTHEPFSLATISDPEATNLRPPLPHATTPSASWPGATKPLRAQGKTAGLLLGTPCRRLRLRNGAASVGVCRMGCQPGCPGGRVDLPGWWEAVVDGSSASRSRHMGLVGKPELLAKESEVPPAGKGKPSGHR